MDILSRVWPGAVVGLAVWPLCQIVAGRWRARRLRDLAQEPPPREAELEVEYGENAYRRSRKGGGISIIAMAMTIMAHPETEWGECYIWGGLALVSIPSFRFDLHNLARKLTVKPVIGVHRDGLSLSNWRRTLFLPWQEVALVYTDPPDSDGYIAPEEEVVLTIESKTGRRWRYTSRDFAEGTPADFAELVGLAVARTAPPGSMLRRDGL